MTIQEALKTDKPFRLKGWSIYWTITHYYQLSKEQILSEDWEVEESKPNKFDLLKNELNDWMMAGNVLHTDELLKNLERVGIEL